MEVKLVVFGNEVTKSKPDPEIFLKAYKKFASLLEVKSYFEKNKFSI